MVTDGRIHDVGRSWRRCDRYCRAKDPERSVGVELVFVRNVELGTGSQRRCLRGGDVFPRLGIGKNPEFCTSWSLSVALLGTLNRTPLQKSRRVVANSESVSKSQSLEMFLRSRRTPRLRASVDGEMEQTSTWRRNSPSL